MSGVIFGHVFGDLIHDDQLFLISCHKEIRDGVLERLQIILIDISVKLGPFSQIGHEFFKSIDSSIDIMNHSFSSFGQLSHVPRFDEFFIGLDNCHSSLIFIIIPTNNRM